MLQSPSISKNAFRGFGNPRVLEGTGAMWTVRRRKARDYARTRLEERLPERGGNQLSRDRDDTFAKTKYRRRRKGASAVFGRFHLPAARELLPDLPGLYY